MTMRPKYYVGKVCEKHPALGGLRNGSRGCPACAKEWAAAKRAAHPALHRTAALKYRATHLEKHKAVGQAWRKANPEKQKALTKAWRIANRAYVSGYTSAKRAAVKKATPAWANLDHIAGMYELCALFRKIGIDMEVDHIAPITSEKVSGFHTAENMQLLHAADNARKSNRWWPDMAEAE
jgi:5-methylcytosine-specific restriction endonuclease McrA